MEADIVMAVTEHIEKLIMAFAMLFVAWQPKFAFKNLKEGSFATKIWLRITLGILGLVFLVLSFVKI